MRKLALLLLTSVVAAAQAASLSGVIRSEEGVPLQGAQITLTSSAASPATLATTSDAQGAYHFSSLPSGAYRLAAVLSGFANNQGVTVSIPSSSADTRMDLSMHRSPSVAGGGAAGSRPQFAAAGIRGLIDPGGYSAPANAAAASGLMKGVADIERTGNNSTTPTNISEPCALEPALKKDVADKPESAEAHLRLGEFYLAHGQLAKAIPLLERARSMNQNDLETLEELAQAYLQGERFDAAKHLLTPLPAVQNAASLHRLLARANEGLGTFSQASQDYQVAANQQPSEQNLFGVGYELILAGLPQDAARAFTAGLNRYPDSMQLMIGLGSAQFLEGRPPQSVQTLLHAVALDPSDPRPYPFLAQAAGVSSEDAERVHAAFENYLSLEPNNASALYYRALDLMPARAANDRRIEVLLEHASVLDPGLVDAHYQLAVLYASRGDYQHAAQELKTVIKLSPDNREAHYRLAVAYRRTGHTDLAEIEMQRFRTAQDPVKAGPDVSIYKFISVLDTPASVDQHERACAGDSP
jgi:tetratricopeptide (TPR) repeat protein